MPHEGGTSDNNGNGKVSGAALVCGGGIAGMQAALDLAEAGYYVYLVEEGPAIGGRMAQLDKTFPTVDCAMCMISPKLVEVGRHPNIELLTYSEVRALEGEAGRFRVEVRRKARLVDEEACTGCAECATVCPVAVPSEFDEGLGPRRAIFRPFAQGVPNVFTISRLGTPPCQAACPLHQNAQGYINLIAQGKFREALDVILRDNPLPAICGRICTHPCTAACTRTRLDDPLNIPGLKRFVTDHVGDYELPEPEQERPERVAIVGSGPAGLMCAYELRQRGYKPVIFEALPVAGGMLAVGIPEFRLPRRVLRQEIRRLEEIGIEIRLDTPVGRAITLEELRQRYAAVFIAIGAHVERKLDIPGEDLPGVWGGIEFLRRVNLGEAVELGRQVLVIGGGNSAIDAARTALRCGAQEVKIVYRRTRAEMPADGAEIAEAEREGVRFEFLAAPLEVLGRGGRAAALKCRRMRLGEPDESGRRRPEPIPGSEFVIPCDEVIVTIGQRPDLAALGEKLGLETTRWGTFQADPLTRETSVPGVFAGGDCVTGPDVVVNAMLAGRAAAISIHRYLNGQDMRAGREREGPFASAIEVDTGGHAVKKRIPMPGLPPVPERRRALGSEVHTGYTEELAREEAARCLSCAICCDCRLCSTVCGPKAIHYDMEEEIRELEVGAVIVAAGFDPFDARLQEEYGFGRYENVVTSLQFERILSASGPTRGRIQRPSDGKHPKKIAFIQCVGSRDLRFGAYCSSVCCVYTAKQALVAKEHDPQLEIAVFCIDVRAVGKGFQAFVERAQAQGVRYVRSLVSEVGLRPDSGDLVLRYRRDGRFVEEAFDLVVLAVGLRPSRQGQALAERLGVALNGHGFAATAPRSPVQVQGDRRGVFVAGAFSGPKDIPETVVQASAAAAAAGELLAEARGRLTREKAYPPEAEVTGEPRIGVFVCHCGSNIASVVAVEEVAREAASLEGVVHAENVLYACSKDSLEHIKEVVQQEGLNRVVVASCTPRTHEPLFQDTLREAGLNKFLFEMADIREQCSWVHPDREAATEKAKALVRMAVRKARMLRPLATQRMGVTRRALVIGGGLSGMTAALSLADQGFPVHLVAKGDLGEDLQGIYRTPEGADVQALRRALIEDVTRHPRIRVHAKAEVLHVSGFSGNFTSRIRTSDNQEESVEHGVIVVATEGRPYEPPSGEYLYGQDARVLTQRQLEGLLHERPEALEACRSVVMIQCVGSRDAERPYCSRTCCGEAVHNALALVEQDPDRRVYVLYRDMRTYGFLEDLYRRAREAGVVFIRYADDEPPRVERRDGRLIVTVRDAHLDRPVELAPDRLVLSVGWVPDPDNETLGRLLKVPVDDHGFFAEAHVKLRPVDFASAGMFVCGLGQAPGSIPELIGRAQAAAGRAATVLSKDHLEAGGVVATVDLETCTACLTCLRECPYGAASINAEGLAEIDPFKCQGCGICAADCPVKAIQLQGFEDAQELSMLEGLLVLADASG